MIRNERSWIAASTARISVSKGGRLLSLSEANRCFGSSSFTYKTEVKACILSRVKISTLAKDVPGINMCFIISRNQLFGW